jgi:putative transposase
MHLLVHGASLQDHNGGKDLLSPLREHFPRLKLIWADSGYNKGGFVEWVKATLGWEVEIVEHPWSGLRGVWTPKGAEVDWEKIRPRGFHVLPRRWVVDNTQSQCP